MFSSRTRQIAAAIVVVVVVVGVAVIALGSKNSSTSSNHFTTSSSHFTAAANRLCRIVKKEIGQAVHAYGESYQRGRRVELPQELLHIIGEMHIELGQLEAPDGKVEQVVEFEQTEFEFEDAISKQIVGADAQGVGRGVKQIESIVVNLNQLASLLDLEDCVDLPVAQALRI